jgi:hypothetical protein
MRVAAACRPSENDVRYALWMWLYPIRPTHAAIRSASPDAISIIVRTMFLLFLFIKEHYLSDCLPQSKQTIKKHRTMSHASKSE